MVRNIVCLDGIRVHSMITRKCSVRLLQPFTFFVFLSFYLLLPLLLLLLFHRNHTRTNNNNTWYNNNNNFIGTLVYNQYNEQLDTGKDYIIYINHLHYKLLRNYTALHDKKSVLQCRTRDFMDNLKKYRGILEKRGLDNSCCCIYGSRVFYTDRL